MQIGDFNFLLVNYLSHDSCHAISREYLVVVDDVNYLISVAAFDL